jgi:hexosaminidase
MKIKQRMLIFLSMAALIPSLSFKAASAEFQAPALHLMPMPRHLTLNAGRLALEDNFKAVLTGCEDARLPASVARFLQRLQMKTGIPLNKTSSPDTKQAVLEIQCKGLGELVQSVAADESYTLEITDRNAQLIAASPIGIFRGLETFLQLVDLDDRSFYVPVLRIEDSPRFRWRGLLVDVSRHWEPIEVIKRIVDGMATVKMNVFHWHLSDDQGFRVESRIFPKLHLKGSDGKYYRQSEIKEVIAYARARGIRVIPEFDMPGHTTAWFAAYPELASAPGPYQIEQRSWGVFDPCMDPTKRSVYSFLDSFIGEMAALFPDEYFHIGGDEVTGKQWDASAKISNFKARAKMKNNRDLQAYFNRQLLGILKKHGKKMIGWDEILHPELPKDIVVQSWRRQASLAEGARLGFKGILSFGYYLDHMRPASFHYQIDPLGKEAANLTEQEQAHILGGEACMWAEFVNPEIIEFRIWPRTAAIAERLWSPSSTQDIKDMYRRLEYVDVELDLFGSMHRKNSDRMLHRMASGADFEVLKNFTDLLKATGYSTRRRARQYYSLTPLNRLADSIMPESETALRFEILVDDMLGCLYKSPGSLPESLNEAQKQLTLWNENYSKLKPVLDQSFLLKEAVPLAELVAELNKKGLESLEYIKARQKAPESWGKVAYALLDRADNQQVEVLIAIAPSIRRLVDIAATGLILTDYLNF